MLSHPRPEESTARCLSRKASWAFSGSAETPSTRGLVFGKRARQPGEVDGLPGAARRVGARIEEQHQLPARDSRRARRCRRRRGAGGRRAPLPPRSRPALHAALPRSVFGGWRRSASRGHGRRFRRLSAASMRPRRAATDFAAADGLQRFRWRPCAMLWLPSLGSSGGLGWISGSSLLPTGFGRSSWPCLRVAGFLDVAWRFLACLGRALGLFFGCCGLGAAGFAAGFWGISCAFSWTYAFLSSLSADQSLRVLRVLSWQRERVRLLGKSDDPGVWLQGIRRNHPSRSLNVAPWAR